MRFNENTSSAAAQIRSTMHRCSPMIKEDVFQGRHSVSNLENSHKKSVTTTMISRVFNRSRKTDTQTAMSDKPTEGGVISVSALLIQN